MFERVYELGVVTGLFEIAKVTVTSHVVPNVNKFRAVPTTAKSLDLLGFQTAGSL